MTTFTLALATALLATGCMPTPARFKMPQPTYASQVEEIGLSGFARRVFEQTAGSQQFVGGQYVYGGGNAWAGQWHDISDADFMRAALENTHCFRRVTVSTYPPLRLDGGETWNVRHGAYFAAGMIETLTLTPLLGMPYVANADAEAWARLYRDGQYVKSYSGRAHFLYVTTFYTLHDDDAKAEINALAFALRDLADQVSADFCGRGESPTVGKQENRPREGNNTATVAPVPPAQRDRHCVYSKDGILIKCTSWN